MTNTKKIGILFFIVFTAICSSNLYAQRKKTTDNRNTRTHQRIYNNRNPQERYRADRQRIQPVRRNPHYRYPKHRRVVRTLPRHHVRLFYRGLPYYFHAGIYYTVYGDEYIVVIPPRGFRIAVLPAGYVRIVVGPSVLFYHSGVYYAERTDATDEDKYEVVQPALGTVIENLPEDSEAVEIDGKNYYQHNDVLYKAVKNQEDEVGYEVVYIKNAENEED